jgi:hypothetical protein
MSPEEIAAFLESRGHRVVQTASCWWYNEYHQDRLYHSFPMHRLVNPPEEEIAELFQRLPRAVGLRFIGPVESGGHKSFMWVRRNPYDLTTLNSKSRNQTRRGLENCQVKKIQWDELVNIARDAHRDTMGRHQVNGTESLGFGIELGECPAYEAWSAFIGGRLAAYTVTLWIEDWVHILLHRSVTADLKFYPNNALVFSIVSELLSRRGVAAVSFGLESLVSLDSLEHFKLGMGFTKEPIHQHFVLPKWIKPLLNPVTGRSINLLANLLPGNLRLQKVAGIYRIAKKS